MRVLLTREARRNFLRYFKGKMRFFVHFRAKREENFGVFQGQIKVFVPFRAKREDFFFENPEDPCSATPENPPGLREFFRRRGGSTSVSTDTQPVTTKLLLNSVLEDHRRLANETKFGDGLLIKRKMNLQSAIFLLLV